MYSHAVVKELWNPKYAKVGTERRSTGYPSSEFEKESEVN